jgi:hypothetical protein
MSNTAKRWETVLRVLIKLEAFALLVFLCWWVTSPPPLDGCGGRLSLVVSWRLSEAKQIAQAHMAYAQDYDERFCPAVVDNPDSEPPDGTDYAASWIRLLEPYVESQDVFYLPAQAVPRGVSRKQTRTRSWGMPMRWRFYSGSDPSPTNLWQTPFGAAMIDGIGGYHRVGNSNYFGAVPNAVREGVMQNESLTKLVLTAVVLGAILLFCVGSIAYDYYTRIYLPNRLQPDPVYDDAPPEQARSPWR